MDENLKLEQSWTHGQDKNGNRFQTEIKVGYSNEIRVY